jgi:hypothetical protein
MSKPVIRSEWREGRYACLTDAQYGSSAGMTLLSDSLKIPCLNTSFESEAPILDCAGHRFKAIA